jgi:aryl-alcohol dehydrogenase-like predicted oxidoreductase
VSGGCRGRCWRQRGHDTTIAQIAIAHALALSPNVLAIPGTGSLAHPEQNITARTLELTAEDLADLG